MQNRPLPSPTTYETSTVKLLSLAHLYVVWFPEAKGNSRVVWNAGIFYRMEIGDLSGNLIPSIFPTTDRRTEVKEVSYVKQLQIQIRTILVNIRIGGGPQHSSMWIKRPTRCHFWYYVYFSFIGCSTCFGPWATYKGEINIIPKLTTSWSLYPHWTTMHGQPYIKIPTQLLTTRFALDWWKNYLWRSSAKHNIKYIIFVSDLNFCCNSNLKVHKKSVTIIADPLDDMGKCN